MFLKRNQDNDFSYPVLLSRIEFFFFLKQKFVEDECLLKALISLKDREDGDNLDNCSLASICQCVWGDS